MRDALSVSDPVTGLKDARYFRARLEEAWAAAVRGGTPLCLLVVELDHFQEVVDRHGPAVGDQVLAEVGRALCRVVRGSDVAACLEDAAQVGGGGLAVLLEDAGSFAALGVGERVLRAVREVAVPAPGGGEVRVTASVGLASSEEAGLDGPDALYARADAAMYAAKQAGRDRLAVSGLEGTPAPPPSEG